MKKKHVLTISLLVIIFIIGNIVYISKFRGLNILDRDSVSIIKEIKSPDGKNKAIVYLDSGSATVPNNIRVAIVKNNKKNAYESNIVYLQNRSDFLNVKWKSYNTLLIEYKEDGDSDIIINKTLYKNINIEYKKQG